MTQPGRTSRYTAKEIEQIRSVYARWISARNERTRLTKTLEISTDMFCRIGRGVSGKKPRAA